MIVDENTKITVGDTIINRVFQGDEQIYSAYPYKRKLNYIQSTAEQYINTLYKNQSNSRYELKINPVAFCDKHYDHCDGQWSGIMGGRLRYFTSDAFDLGYQTDGYFYRDVGGSCATHTYPLILGMDYIISVDKTKGIFNGDTVYINQNPAQGLYNIYLFCLDEDNGAREFSQIKLYYFKIYEGDTLIHDFIPVLDKNNVPCLYDNVGEQFYYNQGAGQFLYG